MKIKMKIETKLKIGMKRGEWGNGSRSGESSEVAVSIGCQVER